MINPLTVILFLLLYFVVLFILARWVEGNSTASRKISGSPITYGLSIAVFCTSWTFYGSVGKAASSGMLYSTVYIGPTITFILLWQVMRRMVRIKHRYRITSIADFISARYDRSASLAVLASCAALAGSTPYIALQIKSLSATFSIIANTPGASMRWSSNEIDLVAVLFMILFTIAFGARHIDPTERHQGMITVVAVQAVVKLSAFLACGVFITYFANNGIGDVFRSLDAHGLNINEFLTLAGPTETSYSTWAIYLLLSMSAIMFLPHQFHVAVVENSDERHLTTAIWIFPLYVLLISLFVVPIALTGIRIGTGMGAADTYVLELPILLNEPWLALFVYIGGVSAAISMVMIASMTLSTMLTNHIILPVLGAVHFLRPLRRRLLNIRWAGIILVILSGYWFNATVGDSFMLVDMGMISFAAALQFAPPILGGIFWERGSKRGAQLGLFAGYAVWCYTLVIPAFAQGGMGFQALTQNGPFGLAFFRPETLFGLTSLDPLSQSVFWSMLFNAGFYMIGSALFEAKATGIKIAREFVSILVGRAASIHSPEEATISLKSKTNSIINALTRYVDSGDAGTMFVQSVNRVGLHGKRTISLTELAELLGEVEKTLAGAVGAAEAHVAIMRANVYTEEERARLSNMYSEILAELKLTPGELKKRVDYYKEREHLLSNQARELEQRVEERTMDLEAANQELQAFSYSVSHDLRTPLRAIDGFSQALLEDYKDKLDDEGVDFLQRIRKASQRMGELIDDILTLSKMTRMEMVRGPVDLSRMALEIIDEIYERELKPDRHVLVDIQPDLSADGDSRLIRLLMENLLENAWKFSSREEQPKISFSREKSDGIQWFVIRDNGAGFDMKYSDKLFQAFSRLHTLEEFEGTGIGLAIVDRVIRKHGGKVRVKSAPNQGAAFFFTFK
jgi:Na+/proline symporter/nitrogen-specific signal transduction histidine kinase